MKRKLFFLGVLCLTLAFFCCFLSTPLLTVQAAGVEIGFFEEEPNNSFSEANIIGTRAFAGKLFAENDADFFSFQNTMDCNLKFLFIPQLGNNVNYNFIIYDNTTEETIVNYNLPNKEESVTREIIGEAGHEYVVIISGDRASNKYYQGKFYQN